MALLLSYLIAADQMDDEQKFAVWRSYNEARASEAFSLWSKSDGLKGKVEDLPQPVAGEPFTSAQARVFAEQAGHFAI